MALDCSPCCGGRGGVELPKRLQPPNLCWVLLGIFVLYILVCALFSFDLGMAAYITCVLVLAFYVAMITDAMQRGYPSIPLLLLIWFFTTFAGVCIGIKNYHQFYAPWQMASTGRTYYNVPADAKASAMGDAGEVHFISDVTLDDTRSLGLSVGGKTYCAAPVLGRRLSVAPHSRGPVVQFWAVGIDCCNSRNNFRCDSAGTDEGNKMRGGIVLHEPSESLSSNFFAPRTNHEEFMQAVRAAAALHELRTVSQPVLVHWVNDPSKVLHELRLSAWLVWGLSTIMLTPIACLTWTMCHYYYDNKIRKAYGQITAPGAGPAVGGQLSQPGSRQLRDPFLLKGDGA